MEEINTREVKHVVDAIHEVVGVDFSNYAVASLRRRILRLADTQRIRSVEEMVDRIRRQEGFSSTFVNEVTVNTTEMFRDPTFWESLNTHVIPVLAQKDLIRIWHAACSTGEEVYSMAILLKEAGLAERARITATDINEPALVTAQKGIYPWRNQKQNQVNYSSFREGELLSAYYTQRDNQVSYDTGLIRNVRFRKHDLVKDPDFSKFDLILCRNVMIYFNSELQESVIRKFTRSMYPGSFLGIGSKESVSWCRSARILSPVNLEEKIFRKK